MLVILIGNYSPDRQESMERFAQMLEYGFEAAGHKSLLWRPTVFFSKPFKSTLYGAGKWFGYIDKWILFPLILMLRLRKKEYKNARFHVCDHSNSPYLKYLPKDKTGITCHDVVAIRQAFGYENLYCPVSPTGKILQKWILKNLAKAKTVAAVSHTTLDQLKEMAGKTENEMKGWKVIHNGFNAEFSVMDQSLVQKNLKRLEIDSSLPFILHVGSSLPRKNRGMIADMLKDLENKWNGIVVFAGEAAETELAEKISKLRLSHRVRFIEKPDHQTLVALYNACDAFIFPSFSEGFGWPIIEAQACGAPVITSGIEPMPEVSGGAALFADPNHAEEFATAYLKLSDTGIRDQLIRSGFANAARFDQPGMINKYLELHGLSQKLTYVS